MQWNWGLACIDRHWDYWNTVLQTDWQCQRVAGVIVTVAVTWRTKSLWRQGNSASNNVRTPLAGDLVNVLFNNPQFNNSRFSNSHPRVHLCTRVHKLNASTRARAWRSGNKMLLLPLMFNTCMFYFCTIDRWERGIFFGIPNHGRFGLVWFDLWNWPGAPVTYWCFFASVFFLFLFQCRRHGEHVTFFVIF